MTAIAPELTTYPIEKFAVTNTCQCGYCPECHIGFTGGLYEPCEDCGTPIEPSPGYCDGDCSDAEHVTDTLTAWLAANHSEHGYLITGSNMGWRRHTGIKVIGADETPDACELLSVDSEWNQEWTINPIEGGKCTATQWHHDAPLGESYTIRAIIGCAEYPEYP